MKIALISDLHANIEALKALLGEIPRHKPDLVVSLGDQVNLGPNPGETLSLMKDNVILMLRGNHERYVLSCMEGDPCYRQPNFESVRFTAGKITKDDLLLPESWSPHPDYLFCHAMPEDDRFPVYDSEKAIPLLVDLNRSTLPQHIICGHGHNPTTLMVGNHTIQSIGSSGCMDEGVPGTTNYSILQIERGISVMQPYSIPYDTSPIRDHFISTRMARECPIVSHIICLQMMNNHDYLIPFVRRAISLSHAKGESFLSQETWEEADASFPWPDSVTTEEFWR